MRIGSSSYSVNPGAVISISTHFCNLGRFVAGKRPQSSATTDMSTVIFACTLECALGAGQDQAAVLTVDGAC